MLDLLKRQTRERRYRKGYGWAWQALGLDGLEPIDIENIVMHTNRDSGCLEVREDDGFAHGAVRAAREFRELDEGCNPFKKYSFADVNQE